MQIISWSRFFASGADNTQSLFLQRLLYSSLNLSNKTPGSLQNELTVLCLLILGWDLGEACNQASILRSAEFHICLVQVRINWSFRPFSTAKVSCQIMRQVQWDIVSIRSFRCPLLSTVVNSQELLFWCFWILQYHKDFPGHGICDRHSSFRTMLSCSLMRQN